MSDKPVTIKMCLGALSDAEVEGLKRVSRKDSYTEPAIAAIYNQAISDIAKGYWLVKK